MSDLETVIAPLLPSTSHPQNLAPRHPPAIIKTVNPVSPSDLEQADPSLILDAEPLELDKLARKIRKSSNFRFERLWFRLPTEPRDANQVASDLLVHIVHSQDAHQVLQSSFDPMYDEQLTLQLPHEHSHWVSEPGRVESVLAQAAADRLGAYSRRRSPATPRERRRIEKLLASIGTYVALELRRGSQDGCPECQEDDNHLFTTWFYGVAWDWCFVVLWPEQRIACVILMTDTD